MPQRYPNILVCCYENAALCFAVNNILLFIIFSFPSLFFCRLFGSLFFRHVFVHLIWFGFFLFLRLHIIFIWTMLGNTSSFSFNSISKRNCQFFHNIEHFFFHQFFQSSMVFFPFQFRYEEICPILNYNTKSMLRLIVAHKKRHKNQMKLKQVYLGYYLPLAIIYNENRHSFNSRTIGMTPQLEWHRNHFNGRFNFEWFDTLN